MNHLPILPLLIPLIAGALLTVGHRWPMAWKRGLGLAATAAFAVSVLLLGGAVEDYGLVVYQVGNWPSFAGVVFVADRLAVLMLGLLALLAFAAQAFATHGEDARGPHWHSLFQLQLFGLAGAFLTHDLFSLFVFFEVLLAASYGLLLHGQGGERLRQGMHYIVLNLVASALFLFAVGVLYAVLGTLNLSDMAVKIAQAPAASAPLLQAGGWLLLVVFALKAAVLPLSFWLPRTYAAAPASTAILFAIMTKLGAYAVLRVHSLLFGAGAGESADLVWPLLFWAGAATVVVAALGALAANRLRSLLGQLVVGAAGLIFMTLGLGTAEAWAAGLFYLVHSTLAFAAFFLLADWVRRQRDGGDLLTRVETTRGRTVLGSLFVLLAVAVAGLPPLGGFLGKALLLSSTAPVGAHAALWWVVLGASLVHLVALARAGSRLFWQQPATRVSMNAQAAPGTGERVAVAMLVTALLAVTLLAANLQAYVIGAADLLSRPALYANAVLGLEPLPSTVPR